MEGQGDELRLRLADRLRISQHILVFDIVGMFRVERIHQAVSELQLGAQFEEGELEVAADTQF